MTWLKTHLRTAFVAGIVTSIPLAVTAFIIWYIDEKTRSLTAALFGRDVPLVGILVALAAIYAVGLVTTSLVGRFLLHHLDWLLGRMPLFRELYQAWKHIALTPGGGEGMFAKVVLVPADGAGNLMLGFTNAQGVAGNPDVLCVFIPAAPNPTSGRLCFVPRAACQFTTASAEEAFKVILSGGNFLPPSIVPQPRADGRATT